MRLKNIFKNMSSQKIAGIAMTVGGTALVLVDGFRLAAGDASVLGGTSLAAAFISGGIALYNSAEKPRDVVVVRGFDRTELA